MKINAERNERKKPIFHKLPIRTHVETFGKGAIICSFRSFHLKSIGYKHPLKYFKYAKNANMRFITNSKEQKSTYMVKTVF
ncbi:hypothetical protein DKC15_005505 [Acinetobacter pittii]|nr:hypothetical protein DKC15_005505 [Acinetobacter pittii]